MDDQLRELVAFHQELTRFNGQLTDSLKDLERSHDAVNHLWQDSMRQAYDAQYTPLLQNVSQYVRREAPRYSEFLGMKIQHVRRYLHGG
ncbi:hypothetical protein [Deinococcus hopiensis]|uniref:WXG100 family type VII secretion target n=1 Tax=Deinococcus hopiensis KR-140 TaxID=695939 RepID=A0A1W1ULV9_9DEIO|nr:hypothetical protein [Deinococcus hopiensis]SMB82003.1 hypothetical protein SAMN00790413_04808 [Deinococcus hopiensis KR-140]